MKRIHFIGIGGIGMSALAQYCQDHGMRVTGSDREASPVTTLLIEKGIEVMIGQNPDNVPTGADAVVYTDAVIEGAEGYPERVRARELGIREYSYFEMLGEVSKNLRTIAVAGTHGKTTTTGMLAKILNDAGASPTAIIGSIVKDFESNYLHGDSDWFVVEADEYKAHLLHLHPEILIVNNLEWDHTDFYPSLEAMQEAFKKAVEKVPATGVIVTNPSHPNIMPILAHAKAKVIDYTKEPRYELQLMGEFNESNARAAAAAARAAFPSLVEDQIENSLATFHGTWRRQEYKGKTRAGADVYDDYAHHPTAVRETLRALRARVSGKLVVAFHPHLYSRTRDLLDDFATAFSEADLVLVAPIYAARETSDGTISNVILAEHIRDQGTDAVAFDTFERAEQVLNGVKAGNTIVTMGAGDIYKVANALVAG